MLPNLSLVMEFLGNVFANFISEKFLSHEALVTGRVTATSNDPCLTKFHAGSEQPLVCVVINNSLPNRQKQQHSLSCIWEILNAG